MAEKEYVYGVGPEASGIGRFLSPLLPVRREVIEPYQEAFIESPDPGKMERVVTPGQYGEPEFAVPEAVQAFLNFKGLARDPEAREAVLQGIAALPELPAELSRRAQMSAQAAMAGERGVYDPKTGTVVGAEEAVLAAPLLTAPGTAASIAMAGDTGGTVLGMLGGTGAKIPSFKPTLFSKIFGRFFGSSRAKGAQKLQKHVDSLIEKGLDGQQLWDAQKGQIYRGYYDPSDGQFRIEFDTSGADIKAKVPKEETKFLGTGKETYYGPSRNAEMTLDEVLDFPEIFDAYPQFRKIKVKPVPPLSLFVKGAYDPKTKTMYLSRDKDKEKVLSTALHELQHAIQTEENFLRGSNPETFLPKDFVEFKREVNERKKVLEDEIYNSASNRLGGEKPPVGTQDELVFVHKLLQEQKNVPDILRDVQELKETTDRRRRIELREILEKKLGGTKKEGYNRYDLERVMETFDNDIDSILETVEEVGSIIPLYAKAKDEYFQNLTISNQATEQYRKTPGEVEARNVQARSARYTLIDPKLRDIYPPDTAELKPEEMVYPTDPNYRRPYLKIGQQGPEPEGMAMGGGVGSLAPVARNMFQGYDDIRRGVGAYAPYTRRA